MSIVDGLPSNHIYYLKVDKNGYLWLATDKGVLKYNGYRFKKFDLSDGLPVEDIWSLFEDKKGRIWLGGIADGVGYIYQDRYTRAKYGGSPFVFYPKYFRSIDDGVAFISSFKLQTPDIGLVRTDSVSLFRFVKRINQKFITPDGSLIMLSRNKLYKLSFSQGNYIRFICDNVLSYRGADSIKYKSSMLNFWVYTSGQDKHRIQALNIKTLQRRYIDFDLGEELFNLHEIGDKNELITTKKTYIYDSGMNLLGATNFKEFFDSVKDVQVTHYIMDHFWGNIWATTSNGIFFENTRAKLPEFADTIGLRGTKYVGHATGLFYRWHQQNRELTAYDSSGICRYRYKLNITDVTGVAALNKKFILIATQRQIYEFSLFNSKLSVYREYKNIKLYFPNEIHIREFKGNYHITGHYGAIKDLFVVNQDTMYFNGLGHGFTRLTYNGDTVVLNIIDEQRIKGIAYDTPHRKAWLYSHNHIALYDFNFNKLYNLTELFTKLFGNIYIDDVLISSKYQTVFVKSYDRVFAYNYGKHYIECIYRDFGIRDARLFEMGKQIVLIGKAGYIFLSSDNAHGFIATKLPNTKYLYYTEIEDIGYLGNDVLVLTNKGIFSASGCLRNSKQFVSENLVRLVASYSDTVHQVLYGDTLILLQGKRLINFDVLNPGGKGEIKINYRIRQTEARWQPADNGDIYLSDLEPGIYYSLNVMAHDDVWQSKTYRITLYVIPDWWQTSAGKKILLTAFVLSALLLIALIVFVTRRFVERNNASRNRKLSLELKSIYAQINPHFIFNSLNTGLFFIKEQKTREAYEHIAAFSDLLRAYIKSARNKFITVNEEVENLENYILLQSGRFEDKFDYRVVVLPSDASGEARIPALIVQPLVENAIVHGLLNKDDGKKGKLLVEFSVSENGKRVVCKVDDNGIGREASQAMQRQSGVNLPHYGSFLVKELIDILNTYEDMYIEISYHDKIYPETGTTVMLTIQYK